MCAETSPMHYILHLLESVGPFPLFLSALLSNFAFPGISLEQTSSFSLAQSSEASFCLCVDLHLCPRERQVTFCLQGCGWVRLLPGFE